MSYTLCEQVHLALKLVLNFHYLPKLPKLAKLIVSQVKLVFDLVDWRNPL